MATDLQEKPSAGYDPDEQIERIRQAQKELNRQEIAAGSNDEVGQELRDMEGQASEKSISSDKLKDAENKSTNKFEASDGSDDFNTDLDKDKKRFSLSGRARKSAIGGVIATMVIGGGIFGGSIASGPAQFIQVSKLMERLHLSDGEDNGESRVLKIAKQIRNKNNPQNNRLGVLGNKLADTWETRMRASGIDPQYNSRTGYFEGFVIDTEKLSNNPEFDTLKDYSPETVQNHFKENLDIDLTISEVDGVKTLSFDGSNIRAGPLKKVTRTLFRSSGYSKIGSAMRARTILKRQGAYSILHPFKSLDKKVITGADSYVETRKANKEAYKKQKIEEIEKGKLNKTIGEVKNTVDNDGDGTPDAASEDSNTTKSSTEEVDQLIKEAGDEAGETAAKGTGKWAGVTNSPTLKKAGASTLLLGVVCMAQSLSAQYDTIQYNNVAQPLIRLGADSIASGNQIMGATMLGQPLDMEQLGFASEKFSADGASWMAAASIQTELGQNPTGPDMPKESSLNKEANPLTDFFNELTSSGVPVGQVCGAFNSTTGQALSFGVDLLGGPISAVVGFAASQAVAPLLTDGLISMISGEVLDVTSAAGPRFGNFVNFGSFLFANDSALASGGLILTKTEAYQIKQRQRKEMLAEFKEKSFATRMFDTTEPMSVAGKLLNNTSPKAGDNLRNIATILPSFSMSFASIGNIFTGSKVFAEAQPYDYGVPKIGFSVADIEDPRFEDPFKNAGLAADTLKANSETREHAEKCFGVKISTEDIVTVSPGDKPPTYADLSNPEYNCSSKEESWTRIRFFILDSQLGDSYACYEGVDDSSCSGAGVTSVLNTNSVNKWIA